MKKIICSVILLSCLALSAGAQSKDSEETWKDIGESGKQVLDAAGTFITATGKKAVKSVKKGIESILTFNCYGSWIHKGKKGSITVTFYEDGTMDIVQRSGAEVDRWTGTFNATGKIVSFNIEAQDHKNWFVLKDSSEEPEVWHLWVSREDDEHVKITSEDIPDEAGKVGFGKGVVFVNND